MNQELFGQVYFGNTIADYCWFAGLMLTGVIFEKLLARFLSNGIYKLVEKHTEGVTKQDFFALMHKPTSWFIILLLGYAASNHIEFPAEWKLAQRSEFGLRMVLDRIYLTLVAGCIAWMLLRMADFMGMILLKKAEKTESKQDDQLIPFAVEFVKIILIVFSIFTILGSVYNVNIGSLIAGLGIGGLALALAAKESLENLLGSFTIFFDKPFVVGDSVKVAGISGTVEKVGFRSTRIRTLDKSFLTVPNKRLIDAELDNLTERTVRREISSIMLVFSTNESQLKTIIEQIESFLKKHPSITNDALVKFVGISASGFEIRILYFVQTNDDNLLLDIKQEVNFRILSIIAASGSAFAQPNNLLLNQPKP